MEKILSQEIQWFSNKMYNHKIMALLPDLVTEEGKQLSRVGLERIWYPYGKY